MSLPFGSCKGVLGFRDQGLSMSIKRLLMFRTGPHDKETAGSIAGYRMVRGTGEEVGRILKEMMQHEPHIKAAGMTKGKLYWWEEPYHTRHVWCSHKLTKWVYDAEASEKVGLFRSKLSHCRQCGASLAS